MDVIYPEDISRLKDDLERYSNKGIYDFLLKYRLSTRTGHLRWVEERTKAILDSKDNVTHYQGVTFDAADGNAQEPCIDESVFCALFNSTHDEMILIETDGVILALNEALRLNYQKRPENF